MSRKIVFLGSPDVARLVLDDLIKNEDGYKIVAVVSQPPARRGRGKKETPTPVHELAKQHQIEVLTPEKAKDPQFLKRLEEIEPDLCITAAYGQMLPDTFLSIPKLGTLNIHPSLLPLYRGAAPVQRAIEERVTTTGVTVAFTIKAMDAGPVLRQNEYHLKPEDTSPELLNTLFLQGSQLLREALPEVFEGKAKTHEQDNEKATYAAKIKPEESYLNLDKTAEELDAQIRAFAGWPQSKIYLNIDGEPKEFKIGKAQVEQEGASGQSLIVKKDRLILPCCQGTSYLSLLEVQMKGKKMMDIKSLLNGLKDKKISIS